MSDEVLFPDPEFGEFIVSANGYFDKDEALWWKPWTNKPARVVVGYVGVMHPSDEVLAYSYLRVNLERGTIEWYYGAHGDPGRDTLLGRIPYRVKPDG